MNYAKFVCKRCNEEHIQHVVRKVGKPQYCDHCTLMKKREYYREKARNKVRCAG